MEVLKWLREVTSKRQYPVKGLFHPVDTEHGGHNKLHPELVDFWQQIEDVATQESTVCVECHLGASDEDEQIFSDLNSKGKKAELSLALEYDESDAVNAYIKRELIDDESAQLAFPSERLTTKTGIRTMVVFCAKVKSHHLSRHAG